MNILLRGNSKIPFVSTDYQIAPCSSNGKEDGTKYSFDSVMFPKSIITKKEDVNRQEKAEALVSSVIQTSLELASDPSTSSISSTDTIQDGLTLRLPIGTLERVPSIELVEPEPDVKVLKTSVKENIPDEVFEKKKVKLEDSDITGEEKENIVPTSSSRSSLATIASSSNNSSEEESTTHEPVTSVTTLTTISEVTTSTEGTEVTTSEAKPVVVVGGKVTQRKWKKAGLMLKTGMTFKDAGKVQQLKKMYYQMKKDSITYL